MTEELKHYRLHRRLSYQMSLATKLMQSSLDGALAPQKISLMQWYILAGVEIENQCSPSDLAAYIGVSRPAVSRLLKSMESDKLIERNIIGEDGRTRMLTLTDDGREKLHASWADIQKHELCFMSKLSTAQLDALNDIINTLLAGVNVEQSQSEEPEDEPA